MKIMTTAARLNVMIQEYIDARLEGESVSHSAVYLQPVNRRGCNWNVEVNCDDDALTCGGTISTYLDELRSTYVIPAGDITAVPAYESHSAATTLQNSRPQVSCSRDDATNQVSLVYLAVS
jgi:hypothetical protein